MSVTVVNCEPHNTAPLPPFVPIIAVGCFYLRVAWLPQIASGQPCHYRSTAAHIYNLSGRVPLPLFFPSLPRYFIQPPPPLSVSSLLHSYANILISPSVFFPFYFHLFFSLSPSFSPQSPPHPDTKTHTQTLFTDYDVMYVSLIRRRRRRHHINQQWSLFLPSLCPHPTVFLFRTNLFLF